MMAVNIGPHFITDFLIMCWTKISLSEVLNVHGVFLAIYLYMTILKVIEGLLGGSITGFLNKV